MEGHAKEILSLELDCDASAPGVVREAIGRIEGVGWILGDVMLVASELVTNAVLHSGCPPSDRVRVSLRAGAEAIKVAVSDPGASGDVARPRPPAELADGGWGLKIVEQLSRRWGTKRDQGYEVWAELGLADSGGRPGTGNGNGLRTLLL